MSPASGPRGTTPPRRFFGDKVLGPVLPVALGLGIWALCAVLLDSHAFPGPLAVGEEAARLFASGLLLTDLAHSLTRVLRGYLLAVVCGLPLGALAALPSGFGRLLRTWAGLLRPIPPIAWVPLAILWLGLGDHSAAFIVSVGAFFPIFSHTAWALSRPPLPLLELATSLGARPVQIWWSVRLPAAAPGVLAGLRTGLALAWTSVIAAELLGAQSGLGYRIQVERLALDARGVLVCMALIGLLGALLDVLLSGIQSHIQSRLGEATPT